MCPRYILLILITSVFYGPMQAAQAQTGSNNGSINSTAACLQPGNWLNGVDGTELSRKKLFKNLSERPFVLLGETHTDASHHRWQLHTMSALLAHAQDLVIGFEMFPRDVQPVLDQWIAGEINEKEFLKKSNWQRVWGYEADLYMPIFRFARMHRIPMVALNVNQKLISRVATKGWSAVPIKERYGLSDPAPPLPEYRKALAEVFRTKLMMMADKQFDGTASITNQTKVTPSSSLKDVVENPDFKRFVAAQLVWDRAMAEGLYGAKKEYPKAAVIGIMGSGHLFYRYGVPYQLSQLGEPESVTLMAMQPERACQLSKKGYADIVFTIKESADVNGAGKKRLRLGVSMIVKGTSVFVEDIAPGSVAEAANINKGDRIIRAAGVEIKTAAAIVDVIEKQNPGFWLPLVVERSGKTLELIAKFSAEK